MLSIALVVACGIMTVIAMRGTYESLALSLERYYRDYRFADVFASLDRAPESLALRIERLPDVAVFDTRVALTATHDVPGLAEPAVGRLLSLPTSGAASLNDIHIVRGRSVDPTRSDEILVSESFAKANNLRMESELGALINGRWQRLRVVGVAISPDQIGEVAPGSVFPDDRRFAVVRMNGAALASAAGMEGAFNEVALRLSPGAREPEVIERLDRLLEPYGGLGAYGRSRQPSHQSVQAELEQNRVTGTLIPAIFLGIAAFLLSVVLSRLIGTQRDQVAVLKAFGYGNLPIAWHYLRFALLPVAGGTALGVGLGVWFGRGLTELYGEFFRFPELRFAASWTLVLGAAGISVLAAGVGALGAVRRAVRLQPAEAMRPESPRRFRPGPIERLGLARRLSTSSRLIVRNVERWPLRSLISTLGVALATAMVAGTLIIIDSTRYMVEHQFGRVQREDLAVTFISPLPASIRHDLAGLEGVTKVELVRSVPVRVRHLQRQRTTALTGLAPGGTLRRIVDVTGRVLPVPSNGIAVSGLLAEALAVGVGDVVTVSVLEGARPELRAPIVAVVDEMFGMSAYVDLRTLHVLLGEAPVASEAFLKVEKGRVADVGDRLKRMRAVSTVYSPDALRATFEQQLSENLLVSVGFLLALACVLTVGVIYNGARISLSERGRELASLRVLGFTRREVAVLLFGEQGLLTAISIPLGWMMGLGLMAYVLAQIGSEQYRFPLIVTGRTFLLAALVTALAAGFAAFTVRRRLDRLDLIEVLKTRE
jgi:putative ABC transport system permease protein